MAKQPKKPINAKSTPANQNYYPGASRSQPVNPAPANQGFYPGARTKPKATPVVPPPPVPVANTTYLYGPYNAVSSWVSNYGYVHRADGSRGVAIEFKDGTLCYYPGTTMRDLGAMDGAQSKGQEVWRRFYNLPYEVI